MHAHRVTLALDYSNDPLLEQEPLRAALAPHQPAPRCTDQPGPVGKDERGASYTCAQLARALCDALGVDVAECPSVGYANVGKRKRSTPDGPSLEEWTNLTRQYGAVDARLHRHAEESAKQLIDGAL